MLAIVVSSGDKRNPPRERHAWLGNPLNRAPPLRWNRARDIYIATRAWGIFACIVATYAASLGSLIEVVNRFGSFFYGSILGVFLLAMVPRARAAGAFFGMIAGMSAVATVTFGVPSVSFLWHNLIGAVVVVGVGMGISSLGGDSR